MPSSTLKPIVWLGDSLRALRPFPAARLGTKVGYALYLAQCGEKHVSAKPLKGLGAAQRRNAEPDLDLIRRRLKQATAIGSRGE